MAALSTARSKSLYFPATLRQASIATAIRLAMPTAFLFACGAGVLATIASSTVQAQAASTAEQKRNYSIAPGTLDKALNRFAAMAEVELSVDAALTRDKVSAGLSGRYTVQEGFAQLLQGKGLQVVQGGNGTYSLRRAPRADLGADDAALLATVTVRDRVDAVVARVNPAATVGSKTPLAQREISQSVSVVTQEQIQDQNIHTLEDALRNVPGVTIRDGDSERPMYYSRGFPMESVQYDGVPVNVANSATSPALIMFDRVEVLRGPAGVLNGLAGSGGAINLVRKRAPKELLLNAEVAAGSYDNYRGEVDAGTPLNESGSARARFAASYQDRGFAQDEKYRKDTQLYGTVEADIDARTTFRVGVSQQELNQRIEWNGLPAYSDYTLLHLSRSKSLVQDWNKNIYRTTSEFAELEHQFDGGWTAKISTTFLQHRNDLDTSLPVSAVDRDTGEYMVGPSRQKWDEDQRGVDAYVAGPFALFGRAHQLTLGGSYQEFDEKQAGAPNVFLTVTLSDPNFPDPRLATTLSPWDRKGTQGGVYGTTRFSIADPLTLVLGARVSWWTSDVRYGANTPLLSDEVNARFTPNVGLVYDIDDYHTAYVSYSGVYTPQFIRDVSNHVLKPIEGEQREAGIKGEYLDKKLNASIAVFRVEEKNRGQTDPTDPNFIYYAQGKARSQGLETQLSGEVLPGLEVLAGYTFTSTKYLDDSLNTNGDFETFTPKHLVKLWANYRLPQNFDKWSAGIGAYLASKTYAVDHWVTPTQRLTQPGYATFDARIAYQASKNIEVALNGTNLFDKFYYRSLGGVSGGNFVGNPREFLLTVRYKL